MTPGRPSSASGSGTRSPTRRSSSTATAASAATSPTWTTPSPPSCSPRRETEAAGRVYNLGGDGHVSLLELAETLIRVAGSGRFRLIPFPDDRKAIDIGDFYADYSAIERELGWRPAVGLEAGLARTLEYYREHGDVYGADE